LDLLLARLRAAPVERWKINGGLTRATDRGAVPTLKWRTARLMSRPPSPDAAARGRARHRVGRIQRACWRALVAARGRALSTSDFIA